MDSLDTTDVSQNTNESCSICLNKVRDRAILDNCFHKFCFVCIKTWSGIKADCPLCKQTYKYIIYNIRGDDHFDRLELGLKSAINGQISILDEVMDIGRVTRTSTISRANNNSETCKIPADTSEIPEPEITSANNTDNNIINTNNNNSSGDDLSDNDEIDEWEKHPKGQGLLEDWDYLIRKRIYERDLWARPIKGEHGVAVPVVETSAKVFSQNPTQCCRFLPWLNREVSALTGNGKTTDVFHTTNIIINLIKHYDITSNAFYTKVYPLFKENTVQFVYEFYNFARHPFDMKAYDKKVRYRKSNNNVKKQQGNIGDANNTDSGNTENNSTNQSSSRERGRNNSTGQWQSVKSDELSGDEGVRSSSINTIRKAEEKVCFQLKSSKKPRLMLKNNDLFS